MNGENILRLWFDSEHHRKTSSHVQRLHIWTRKQTNLNLNGCNARKKCQITKYDGRYRIHNIIIMIVIIVRVNLHTIYAGNRIYIILSQWIVFRQCQMTHERVCMWCAKLCIDARVSRIETIEKRAVALSLCLCGGTLSPILSVWTQFPFILMAVSSLPRKWEMNKKQNCEKTSSADIRIVS